MRAAVVPCSARKLEHAAPARELYTGPLYRSALLAAEAMLAAGVVDRVLILSAAHGLVELDVVLEPYNVRIGDPGTITTQQLAQQLEELEGSEELGWDVELVPLLPKDYAAALEAARVECRLETYLEENPLAGSRGILEQRRRLRELRELHQLEDQAHQLEAEKLHSTVGATVAATPGRSFGDGAIVRLVVDLYDRRRVYLPAGRSGAVVRAVWDSWRGLWRYVVRMGRNDWYVDESALILQASSA